MIYITHHNQNEVVTRLDKLELEGIVRERADHEASTRGHQKNGIGNSREPLQEPLNPEKN